MVDIGILIFVSLEFNWILISLSLSHFLLI